MSSQQLGQQAEQLALEYLQQHGLTLVEQNVHSRKGEIDLIMLDDDILTFIEVRFRQSNQFGSAVESVNYQKQKRIIHTAELFLQQCSKSYSGYRFDVIAISPFISKNNIKWIKDAFQLS